MLTVPSKEEIKKERIALHAVLLRIIRGAMSSPLPGRKRSICSQKQWEIIEVMFQLACYKSLLNEKLINDPEYLRFCRSKESFVNNSELTVKELEQVLSTYNIIEQTNLGEKDKDRILFFRSPSLSTGLYINGNYYSNFPAIVAEDEYCNKLETLFKQEFADLIRIKTPVMHSPPAASVVSSGEAGSEMQKEDGYLNIEYSHKGSLIVPMVPPTSTKVIRAIPAALYKFRPSLIRDGDTVPIERKVPDSNQFRTVGVNYNERELAEVMKGIITYAADNAGISIQEAIKAIEYSKSMGGVSNIYNDATGKYKTNNDAVPKLQDQKKIFSAKCQELFKRVGLHTGRQGLAKAVGMRTFRIPDWVVNELKHETTTGTVEMVPKDRGDLIVRKAKEYLGSNEGSVLERGDGRAR